MIKELTALECCDNQNGNSKSYNLQVKKTLFIKVLIFMSKML